MDIERLLESKLLRTQTDGNIGEVLRGLSVQDKEQALPIAANCRLYEVVIYLVDQGVSVQYVDSRQNNLVHTLLDYYTDRRDLLLQCILKLVDSGVDVNQVNADKDTPISIACSKGWCELVLHLLEHGVDVHYVDSHQNNLMHLLLGSYNRYDNTCRRDLLLPCVVQLVEAGVDFNQVNDDKDTPVYIAAKRGLYEVVVYLLEQVVDLRGIYSREKNLMHTLLYSCVRYSRYDNTSRNNLLLQCIIKLVDAGADVNQLNADKETPISIAAREGLCEVVMYMLEHGVNVQYVDSFNCNILHYVLGSMYSYVKDEEKYVRLVNTLMNMTPNMRPQLNQPDYKSNTPLFNVGKHKPRCFPYNTIKLILEQDIYVQLKCRLINMLLEAGCNVNHQNELGRTALMHHIKHQAYISILKLLIPRSDLSLTDNNGDTAISYCVNYYMINSRSVFKILVDSGLDLMSRNNGFKLFFDILKCKRLGVFSYFLGLKLIVKGVTDEEENMLHLLARVYYGYPSNTFNWLLNNELDINHRCSRTNTPAMIAALLLNGSYLELLTRHPGLEINARNNQGHTALHCCIIGFTMFKDGLNKRHVNDVVKYYCGRIYPIYMACIDSLLAVDGINVNIKDHRGRTSLMMAAMKNDRVLTRKLLQAGAQVNVLDYSGRSALQYLDIYESVFDLTSFKLLLSHGNTDLLNLPCIDGNTIIQTALCFPYFWEPCQTICFIRYLVAENCSLQSLVASSVESSYNQIDLTELSLRERDKLRKLLYVSGAEGDEIMTSLNFVEEDHTTHSRGLERFVSFCSNISLMSLCRRIIRQNLGLGIREKVKDLELPRQLNDFLLLKDILHPKDYHVDYIDDGCNDFDDDDDYDGYDIDDRGEDYSQYNYEYFTLNTDHELRQHFQETSSFPNGENLDKHKYSYTKPYPS